VVLIDFHQAEDRGTESGEQTTDQCGQYRTLFSTACMRLIPLCIGTPRFMARLVRIPRVYETSYRLSPMPQLNGVADERYKACVSNRIRDFPQNDLSSSKINLWDLNKQTIQSSHRLSYDAESILWLLLYWAVQVQPEKGDHTDEIDEYLWMYLTDGDFENDPRTSLVPLDWRGICHPDYRPLDDLLKSLFAQLAGYQEYVLRPEEAEVWRWTEGPPVQMVAVPYMSETQDPRMKDEYLHEALQRTILGFIVENIEEPFMRAQISSTRRPKEGEEMAQSTKTSGTGTVGHGVKRDHATMAGAEAVVKNTSSKRYACPHVFPSRRR
jgi:hypothetical protein